MGSVRHWRHDGDVNVSLVLPNFAATTLEPAYASSHLVILAAYLLITMVS